jgi:hypothetical protein
MLGGRGGGQGKQTIKTHVVRSVYKVIQKEFPDAFPHGLNLHGTEGPAQLADRTRVLLNHWRRLAMGSDNWNRWNQCQKGLQTHESNAVWEMVQQIHCALIDDLSGDTIDGKGSGKGASSRSLVTVDVDHYDMPEVPKVKAQIRRFLQKQDSEVSRLLLSIIINCCLS